MHAVLPDDFSGSFLIPSSVQPRRLSTVLPGEFSNLDIRGWKVFAAQTFTNDSEAIEDTKRMDIMGQI